MQKKLIIAEFDALKKLGVKVPKKAYKLVDSENLDEYEGMSYTEVADLLIELAGA